MSKPKISLPHKSIIKVYTILHMKILIKYIIIEPFNKVNLDYTNTRKKYQDISCGGDNNDQRIKRTL